MKITIIFTLLLTVFSSQIVLAEDINLGVLAPRGELKALQKWTDFGKYISDSTGKTVKIIALAPPKVLSAASNNEVNFVLSHPAHTVALKEKYSAQQLASINKNSGSQFAGLIITRKDKNIRTAEDLRGKKVMSMKFKVAAGAYIFQTYHLKLKGIDVHKDFASMIAGKKQDDLVLAVKAGVIDAAFVRSGLLESMNKEGKINIDDFYVIDSREDKALPLLHSTVLYPEWYLTALNGVDTELANSVKKAALSMTSDLPASKKAKIKGFIDPLPLDNMIQALKTLNIAPFN
ncbi:MAG: PhnD/SsuA/transferrin family substrate-binding protein [Candidatus Bathyarchaeota archaeon]|nr:PhnD/SsuA/transferrin family substrate-binding protein [Candidatus Bathyarchaeota archaeon]